MYWKANRKSQKLSALSENSRKKLPNVSFDLNHDLELETGMMGHSTFTCMMLTEFNNNNNNKKNIFRITLTFQKFLISSIRLMLEIRHLRPPPLFPNLT